MKKNILKGSVGILLCILMLLGCLPLHNPGENPIVMRAKASTSYAMNISYSSATGSYDNASLPAAASSFYYGETPYLNLACGNDVYCFEAKLYIYRDDGSLYDLIYWSDVKAEMGWTYTTFSWWAQPVTFDEIGNFYFYYVLTYNTSGAGSSTRDSFTTQSVNFAVVDPTPVIRTDVSTVNLNLSSSSSRTISVWKNEDVSYEYYFQYDKNGSSAYSCSWGNWNNNVAPLTITANSAASNQTLTLRMYKDVDGDNDVLMSTTYVTVNITSSSSSYTLSYNANGGSNAPSSQTNATSYTISSTVPTRFGYTFLGWSKSSSATSATYYPGDTISLSSSTTLYAVWQSASSMSTGTSYTAYINFAYQERYYTFTPSSSGDYIFESTGSLDSKVVVYNSSGTSLGSNDDDGTDNNFRLTLSLTSGTKYYVKVFAYSSRTGSTSFSVRKDVAEYTLSYNANGGSDAPSSQTGGSSYTISSTVPTRFGYTFLGWSKSSSATSATYYPGDTISLSSSTTLYAVWQSASSMSTGTSYTANINFASQARYYTFTPSSSGDYIFESTGSLDSKVVVYNSSGSSLGSNDDGGTNNNFLLKISLTSGTKYYVKVFAYGSNTGNTSFTVTKDSTGSYTLSYDANGGSGAPSSQTGSTSYNISSTIPTKFGYNFLGWSTSGTTGTEVFYPGEGVSLSGNVTLYAVWQAASALSLDTSCTATFSYSGVVRYYTFTPSSSGTYIFESTGSIDSLVTVYNSSGSSIDSNDDGGTDRNFKLSLNLTAGTTYYVKVSVYNAGTGSTSFSVRKQSYTLSYNANAGSNAPASQTGSTSYTVSSTIPTRFGYTFLGWATSSSASAATYYPGGTISISSATTLYAVWQSANSISLSSSYTANISFGGQARYYTFTPSSSGDYIFESTGSIDSKVDVYNSSGTLLDSDDDDGTDRNFLLTVSLTAGTTYYVKVFAYGSGTGSTSFSVKRDGPAYYTLSYNANGGSNAPSSPDAAESYSISETIPSRFGYTFLGWSKSSTATSASYKPGDSITISSGTTLYAVWQAASSISANAGFTDSITIGNQVVYRKFTPSVTAEYVIYSTSTSDTKVYLYNASGTQLSYDDDSGDGNNFRLAYTLTAGSTYYYAIRFYSSTRTGSIPVQFGRTTTVSYDANGGSGAPSSQKKDYGLTLSLSTFEPEYEGHEFRGWALSSNATTVVFAPGDDFTQDVSGSSSTSTITLYAVWSDGQKPTGSITSSTETAATQTATLEMTDNIGVVGYYWGTSATYSENAYTAFTSTLSKTVTQTVSNAGTYYLVVKDSEGNLSTPVSIQYAQLTFNANGGTTSPAKQLIPVDQPVSLRSDVLTRNGYTFRGWNTSSNATQTDIQPGSRIKITGNITVYAVWEPASALTLNSAVSAQIDFGAQQCVYSYTPTESGEYVVYSTGDRDTRAYLYDTSGNLLDSDDDDGDGNNFRLIYNLSEGSTYYYSFGYYSSTATGSIAVKFGKQYTVTFNANGGSNAPASQSKDFGTSITLSASEPNRSGYTFAGWATSPDSKTVAYAPGDPYQPDADVTLYAIWTDTGLPICTLTATNNIASKQTATLNMSDNDGVVGYYWGTSATYTNNTYVPFTATTSKTVTLEITDPGTYYFVAKDTAGNVSVVKSLTFVSLTYSAADSTSVPAMQLYNSAEGTTLAENVPVKNFVVTFNGNGGTVNEETRTFAAVFTGWSTESSNPSMLYAAKEFFSADGNVTMYANWENPLFETGTEPVRAGYTFTGWYTQDGEKVTQSTRLSGNLTVYAHWQVNNYTVTFDASGGTASSTSKNVTYGESFGTLPTAERAGYTFNGWYTQESSGNKVTSSSTVNFVDNCTLYAQWTANTYTVTFDAAGGTCSSSEMEVVFDSSYGELPVPQKNGYVFVGWFASPSGSAQVKKDTIVSTAGNHTLYAQWKEILTVSYDANGGWDAPPQQTYTSGESIMLSSVVPKLEYTVTLHANGGQLSTSSIVVSGLFGGWRSSNGTVYAASAAYSATQSETLSAIWEPVRLPAITQPTRNGYTFNGWYTQAEDGTKIDVSSFAVTQNCELYAQWTVDEYVVSFDANGGHVSQNTKDIRYDAAYGALPTPQWDGYTFTGWYTSADGGNLITQDSIVQTTCDHTLYAHWNKILTLSYRSYESDPDYPVQNYYAGDYVTISDSVPAKTYTIRFEAGVPGVSVGDLTFDAVFVAWEGDDGKKYQPNAVYMLNSDLTLTATWQAPVVTNLPVVSHTGYSLVGWIDSQGNLFENGSELLADTVLYASWTAESYTVSFNFGDAQCSMSEKTVTFGNAYGTLPTPTRTGYSFDGWFTSATGGSLISEQSAVSVANDHTLYAHWIANTCRISFDANGGTCETASKTVTYGEPVGELPVPQFTGMKFAGWYTQADGGEQILAETIATMTEPLTLYAHWSQDVTYAVSYMLNGGTGEFPASYKTHDADFTISENIPQKQITVSYELNGGELPQGTEQQLVLTSLFSHWLAETPDGDKEYAPGALYTYNAKVVFVAQWQPASAVLPVAIRNGYTFKGWYTGDDPEDLLDSSATFTKDVVLKAAWEVKSYNVSFDTKGGNSTPDAITVTYNSPYGELPVCEKTGHQFVGWSADENGTQLVTAETVVSKTESHVLYAVWKKYITITFDANGGSGQPDAIETLSNEPVSISSRSPVKSFQVFFDAGAGNTNRSSNTLYPAFAGWNTRKDGKGDVIEPGKAYTFTEDTVIYAQWQPAPVGNLPDASLSGCSFIGWFTQETGGEIVTQLTEVSETTTFYAQWAENSYTIYFDANGGSVEENKKRISYGAAFESLPTPEREGYDFVGWYTSNNVLITATSTFLYSENIVLYAKWSPRSVKLTFNANGGFVDNASKNVIYDELVGTLPVPVWADHAFLGWFTSDGVKVTEGTRSSFIADQVLTARWVDIISVRYETNGGIGTPAEQRTNAGETLYISSTVPEKTISVSFDTGIAETDVPGRTMTLAFSKWNTNQDGSGASYGSNDAAIFSESTTLYAQWIGAAIGDLPTIAKEGYVFVGWFTDAQAGEQVTSETKVKENTVLYARFSPIRYTIRFFDGETLLREITAAYNDSVVLSAEGVPGKDGFTFKGWAVRLNGEKVYNAGATVTNLSLQDNAVVNLYTAWKQHANLETLTYSFANSNRGFGYPADYVIPEDAYFYIFGRNVFSKQLVHQRSEIIWGGNCYGLSSTSIMFNNEESGVETFDFNEAAFNVSDLELANYSEKFEIELISFIEALQVSQIAPVVQQVISQNKGNITGLLTEISEGKKIGKLPILCMVSPAGGGHAIVGYDVQVVSSTETRIRVYDCNYPNDDRYLYVYTSEDGKITGWNYQFSSREDWGSEFGFNLTYVPYDIFEYIFENRGNAKALGLSGSNTFQTNSMSFTIYDYKNDVVCTATEDGFVSNSADVFQVYDFTSGAEGTGGYSIMMPVDVYQVVNSDTSLDEFEAQMMNVYNMSSVSTKSDGITFIVADEINTNAAVIAGANGAEYEITMISQSDTKENEIVLAGIASADDIQLSLVNNNLSCLIGDAINSQLTINGKLVDLEQDSNDQPGDEPQYLPGDVNNDGAVSSVDARLALRCAVGLENFALNSPAYRACDVNNDGVVSSVDARSILRAAVGLEDPEEWGS